MTIEEFRRHQYLPSKWASELATNETIRTVLAVMEDNHPARYAIRGDKDEDVSPTRAAIELGLTRGYSKYGDTLRLLASPIIRPESIGAPSYEPVEEQKNA
jgi:hypothetical protein